MSEDRGRKPYFIEQEELATAADMISRCRTYPIAQEAYKGKVIEGVANKEPANGK